jgi:spore coat polysaccharide biosynthesis protein SpsF (cytidylyltransferase family)
VRRRTLELVAEKYNMQFSDDEKQDFGKMEGFGVPLNELKGLMKLKSSERNKKGLQKGIPHDSIDNQLKEWVIASRKANAEIMEKQLDFAIKGDAKEEYPKIKQIMDILQDQNVNKFNLVTGLRSKDF